mmetsp:Transcript_30777/g.86260  ORF Transcript_30777/g.86260 Transcript_30777/m.86260 type:complete len:223 (+) Transcript_30777:1132-1800(+)
MSHPLLAGHSSGGRGGAVGGLRTLPAGAGRGAAHARIGAHHAGSHGGREDYPGGPGAARGRGCRLSGHGMGAGGVRGEDGRHGVPALATRRARLRGEDNATSRHGASAAGAGAGTASRAGVPRGGGGVPRRLRLEERFAGVPAVRPGRLAVLRPRGDGVVRAGQGNQRGPQLLPHAAVAGERQRRAAAQTSGCRRRERERDGTGRLWRHGAPARPAAVHHVA